MWLSTGCIFISDRDLLQRIDPDEDGVDFPFDCDDGNDEIGEPTWWYFDGDGDGFGSQQESLACGVLPQWVTNDEDCDDDDPTQHPGGTDACDGINNDCDGSTDEDAPQIKWGTDVDGDGFGSDSATITKCYQPEGYTSLRGDCDDNEAFANPGVGEICDGLDNNCDGQVDEYVELEFFWDEDDDGYGQSEMTVVGCEAPDGYVSRDGDCDDALPAINPGKVENCTDGIDTDCDGLGDAAWLYTDADGDGVGTGELTYYTCPIPETLSLITGDCDDSEPSRYPGATEDCNDGIDNNCDEYVDTALWWHDNDGDGLGSTRDEMLICAAPAWYVGNDHDCNDSDDNQPVYVDPLLGDDDNPGNRDRPFATLSGAIKQSKRCIYARAGTYHESIVFGGSTEEIRSEGGSAVTVIDAGESECEPDYPETCVSAITVPDRQMVSVTGFTVTGGTGTLNTSTEHFRCGSAMCTDTTYTIRGGGLHTSGAYPTLTDIVFQGNYLPEQKIRTDSDGNTEITTSEGGGVYAESSDLTLKNVSFERNEAARGGGLYQAIGSTEGEDVSFVQNRATEGGGYYIGQGGRLVADRLSATDNTAEIGGAGHVDGRELELTRSRMWCNEASQHSAALYIGPDALGVKLKWIDLVSNDAPEAGSTLLSDASSQISIVNFVSVASSTEIMLWAATMGNVNYGVTRNWNGEIWGGYLGAGAGVIDGGDQHVSVTCDGDPSNDDFTLRADAEAIDAANPADGTESDGTPHQAGSNGGAEGPW